ncbi:hypothetical protein [Aeromicrobium wangtongii]|uniref:Uncharacterized protein n=1 Tax=Aeromicrobium wangtongii TaxID=2969247 RepID=A0ABY5MFZ5_9ACTN|nr:hypothetical protein [Aeromicrobium wangtongii]MCD9197276.1 hypothetical protein [Aeromicrobium wangtongii]MCL3818197.1 hypothetical protein [Aeromicrobium wangtongii]UUP14771.1 hypothetical protein NQV15_05525 [Aeromicrobium wangtongii]
MSKELLERTDIMYNDFTVQLEQQRREHELAETLEHRRVAAERAVQQQGSRLGLLAFWARSARANRANRAAGGLPVGPVRS